MVQWPRFRVANPRQHGEHTFPAFQIRQLAELVPRWGITPEELPRDTGVSPADPDDPEARLPVSSLVRVTERARALTGEPGLGFYLGLQKRASVYGYLGVAMTSAGWPLVRPITIS